MASNRPPPPPPKKTERNDGIYGSRTDTNPLGFDNGCTTAAIQGTAGHHSGGPMDQVSVERDWESANTRQEKPTYENLEEMEKSIVNNESSQQLPEVVYDPSQQFLFLNDEDEPEVIAFDTFRPSDVGHDTAGQRSDVTHRMLGSSINGSSKEADNKSFSQRTEQLLRAEDLYGVVNRQNGGGPGSKHSNASSIDRTAPTPQLNHPLPSSASSTTTDSVHTDVTSPPLRGVYHQSTVDPVSSVRPTPAGLSNWGASDYDFTSSSSEQLGIFDNFILVGPSKSDMKTTESVVPVQMSSAPAYNHEPRLPVKLLQLFEPPEPRTFSLLGVTNTESSDFNLSASRLKPATPQQQICLEKDKVMKVKGAGIARGFENHHFNNHLNLSSVESFPADSEDPPPSRSTSTTRVIRKEKAEKNKRTNLTKKTRFCNSRMVVAIVLSVFITALFSLPAGFVAGWFGHEAYKN